MLSQFGLSDGLRYAIGSTRVGSVHHLLGVLLVILVLIEKLGGHHHLLLLVCIIGRLPLIDQIKEVGLVAGSGTIRRSYSVVSNTTSSGPERTSSIPVL